MRGPICAAAFFTVLLFAASCGTADNQAEVDPAEASQADGSSTTESSSVSSSTSPEQDPEVQLQPDRFGDFPAEPSDEWVLADPYEGTSFVNLKTGEELDVATVDIRFGGRRNVGISIGGCSVAGGQFDLVDGRFSNLQPGGLEAGWCEPTDQEMYEVGLALMEEEPEVRVDRDRLLLLSPTYRLELLATGPGVFPALSDTERFKGISSTVPGLEADRLRVDSPAFFVIHATVPSCEMWGGTTAYEGDISNYQMEPTGPNSPCKNAAEADKTIEAFLLAGFKATRKANLLHLTNEQGSLTLELQAP